MRVLPRIRRCLPLLAVLGLGLALGSCATSAPGEARLQVDAEDWKPGVPTELFDVVRVVDGDTIHVLRDGEVEKLRLLSVDTEEKLSGRPSLSATKPETLFGQECADWAQAFFEDLREGDAPPRVGLLFPGGEERRGGFGRLLCHVILPDGTDFNLLLVQLGKSPYFNKYGNSRICHAAFVAAQEKAREEELGVWNPATNRPASGDAPAAKRPYDRLLPWWEARAEAIDGFRAADPATVVDAEDPAALRAALERCAADPELELEVFGTVDRFFDEDDGSRTVLFRSSSRDEAFRASVPAAARGELAIDLDATTEEFRQNYVYVRGRVTRGPRGYRMEGCGAGKWRLAGPEPSL